MQVRTIEELASQCSADWPHLFKARETSLRQLRSIEEACRALVMPDTSLVVFGSLARREFTPGSDIDWTLLVDGFTIPEHLTMSREIGRAIASFGNTPGRTGTFGNLASSHNLIHYIGGEDDSNANTTRRALLLLESRAVGDEAAFNRVRNNILRRYLEEDLGLWRPSTELKIPHFLLNDFARYWRTMAVDFADKQHDRFHEGFALRNIKLRLSRKLIYIAGLLACLRCTLDFPEERERSRFFSMDNSFAAAVFVRSLLEKTPLDQAAETLVRFVPTDKVLPFFTAYDHFVGLLNDKEKRETLEHLSPAEMETNAVYREARGISHNFREAIANIFLNPDNEIGNLTIRYGVF